MYRCVGDVKKEMEPLLAIVREGDPEQQTQDPTTKEGENQQNVTACNGDVTAGQNINP
jgi:hypothetical protein